MDKDQSSWNSDWATKAKRGRACRSAGEEWTDLEKNNFHPPFLICATDTALCPQVCWAPETAWHLWWQRRCSLCSLWRWAQAGNPGEDTAHPAQERCCRGWWPCCCTQKSLHSKYKMSLLLDEFPLACKRCESPDEVISPRPLLFGWGGFKRGILKYPVPFPKVFIKTAHKVSLESLGGL